MTFEDWYKSVPDNVYVDQKFEDREHAASSAWNAAIQASRDSLDRVEFPGNAEALWFRLDEELRKLLTGC